MNTILLAQGLLLCFLLLYLCSLIANAFDLHERYIKDLNLLKQSFQKSIEKDKQITETLKRIQTRLKAR